MDTKFSPERICIGYPYINESIKKHMMRYEFASQFVSGLTLDCACGSGYGSKILVKNCEEVFGVDNSKEAIEFAKDNNTDSDISYFLADIKELNDLFLPNTIDSVVSLETIEHVDKQTVYDFFGCVHVFLKPGGTFICSSPMLRYKDGKPYVTNPYHINEMPKHELMILFETSFPGYTKHYYHQKKDRFVPLLDDENTGFCVAVMRKK